MIQAMRILIVSISVFVVTGCGGYEQLSMRNGVVAAVGLQNIHEKEEIYIDRLFFGPFESADDIPSFNWEMPDGTIVFLPDIKDKDSLMLLPSLNEPQYGHGAFPTLYPESCELDHIMNCIEISDAYYYYYFRLPDNNAKYWSWANTFGFCLSKQTDKIVGLYIGEKTHLWNKDRTKRYEFPFTGKDFVELFGEAKTVATYRETIWTALQSQKGSKNFIETAKVLEKQDKAQLKE